MHGRNQVGGLGGSVTTLFQKLGIKYAISPTFLSLGFVIYWFHTKLPLHILQQNCAHGFMIFKFL